MATTSLLTAKDVERLPEGERFELIRGERREVSPPGGRHGRLQARIAARMGSFVEEQRSGAIYTEAGFVISQGPDTLVAPDVAFVRSERLLTEEEEIGFLHQIPDIAVEVVSPGDSHSQVVENIMTYLESGVPLVWEIDPQRQRVIVWSHDQTVQELKAGDTLDGGDVLPGFRVPVADLFPR